MAERRCHSLVPGEGVHRYVPFVEADIGEHLAVRTEVEGTAESEFFLINPVGYAVQYFVELAVDGNL